MKSRNVGGLLRQQSYSGLMDTLGASAHRIFMVNLLHIYIYGNASNHSLFCVDSSTVLYCLSIASNKVALNHTVLVLGSWPSPSFTPKQSSFGHTTRNENCRPREIEIRTLLLCRRHQALPIFQWPKTTAFLGGIVAIVVLARTSDTLIRAFRLLCTGPAAPVIWKEPPTRRRPPPPAAHQKLPSFLEGEGVARRRKSTSSCCCRP